MILDTLHGGAELAGLPMLLLIGTMAIAGLFVGKLAGLAKLPSIIGFMLVGVVLGPSLLGLLDLSVQAELGFLSDIALGFVALSIGLELRFKTLRSLGSGIAPLILGESFVAFAFVTILVYLVSKDLPLALLFGGLAPASAPAGTVAIIREYRASGRLTQALYAVVGFDDGLGIIIFGFASAVAKALVLGDSRLGGMLITPLAEIGLSSVIGVGVGLIYGVVLRPLTQGRDVFIFTVGVVLLTIGICELTGASLIFTNLVVGVTVVNSQRENVTKPIGTNLTAVMPLLFVLFFILAGANLHISALPALGLIGVTYVVARSAGKIAGSWLGAIVGRTERKIRNLTGLGILSQAGVAIGLALVVKEEFAPLGESGARIGGIVITTITASSIVFEIVGPILAKYALKRAGEIPQP